MSQDTHLRSARARHGRPTSRRPATPHDHVATAARAKARIVYQGKTRAGDPIKFTLAGSRVTKLSAYVPTLCLPTEGAPGRRGSVACPSTPPYLTGIALPMIVCGIGRRLGLSTLTNAGMAGVAPRDPGAAGGLVNVAHHIGGAFGVGILVTAFAVARSGARGARELLALRVSASLTAAAVLMVLALVVTLIAHPRKWSAAADERQEVPPLPGTANRPPHPQRHLSEKIAAA